MKSYTGKSVFEGIVIGKIKIIDNTEPQVKEVVGSTDEETQKFINAKSQAITELKELYKNTVNLLGDEEAEIFNMQITMLEDADLEDAVMKHVRSGKGAAAAVGAAGEELAKVFIGMKDNPYMQARAEDVRDISNRLNRLITGRKNKSIELDEPMILASEDFTPEDVVKLDKSKVLGFVTKSGSGSSHTAILARTRGLPSVVNIRENIEKDSDGKLCIVDAYSGKVYLDPDDKTLKKYTERKKIAEDNKKKRQALIGKRSVTVDGKEVKVYCNIGSVEEVNVALSNDCEGIGLFRSEFVYMESDNYPDEETQYRKYAQAAKMMGNKLMVIRTMDIGADKQVSYFNLPKEENPALGMRSVRICMERPEILHTQLRAIYRASAHGRIAVMVPMIVNTEEVLWVKEMAKKVRAELTDEKIAFDEKMQIGIMIETPAAAIIADKLAEEVDFFSIGTNDLTQYTLAVDRQNPRLEKLSNGHHTAILRLIKLAAEAAHSKGKWIGICGELARDFDLTEFFVKCGIDELSVSPPYVLALREKIREIDSSKVDIEKYIK